MMLNSTQKNVQKKLSALGVVCGGFALAIAPWPNAAIAQSSASNNCPSLFYEEPFTNQVAAPAGCPLTVYQQQLGESAAPYSTVSDSLEVNSSSSIGGSSGDLQAQTGTEGSVIDETERASRLNALQRTVIQRTTGGTTDSSSVVTPSSPAGSSAGTYGATGGVTGGVTGSTPPLPEGWSQEIAIAIPVNNQLSISVINNTGTTVDYEVVGDTDRRELMMDDSVMLQGIALPTTLTFVRPDGGFVELLATTSQEGMLELVLTPTATFDNAQSVVRVQEGGQVFLN
jgi:hypothetical protein